MIWQFVSVAIFLTIVVAIYIREIFLLSVFLISILCGEELPSAFLTRSALINHFLALAGILCILYGYFIEPHWIELKAVEISTAKLARTSLRIVQISDLHCETKIKNENKMVEIVNSLNPDIIVFTGDSLNTPKALSVFRDVMGRLKASVGKYAVTGNDDFAIARGLDLFRDTGFHLLNKESVRLTKEGETFFISGLDYVYPDRLREVLGKVPSGFFSIFLYHKSDLIEDLKGANVDLYLAGHTHGGQVALPFYGALITLSKYGKKYESGEYSVNGITLYVNRGIGTEGNVLLAARFFARPEITVFDIKPAKQN